MRWRGRRGRRLRWWRIGSAATGTRPLRIIHALVSGEGGGSDLSRPYPFYLAYALEEELPALGLPEEWQAEWKWDGIRGQMIRRGEGYLCGAGGRN